MRMRKNKANHLPEDVDVGNDEIVMRPSPKVIPMARLLPRGWGSSTWRSLLRSRSRLVNLMATFSSVLSALAAPKCRDLWLQPVPVLNIVRNGEARPELLDARHREDLHHETWIGLMRITLAMKNIAMKNKQDAPQDQPWSLRSIHRASPRCPGVASQLR